jgi:hypothetical protein
LNQSHQLHLLPTPTASSAPHPSPNDQITKIQNPAELSTRARAGQLEARAGRQRRSRELEPPSKPERELGRPAAAEPQGGQRLGRQGRKARPLRGGGRAVDGRCDGTESAGAGHQTWTESRPRICGMARASGKARAWRPWQRVAGAGAGKRCRLAWARYGTAGCLLGCGPVSGGQAHDTLSLSISASCRSRATDIFNLGSSPP